ncbi:MAG: class I SAM-dependent methyltransferase [Armatimonadetes bacterium]|nr:class I SAM-dependent methyltransferase [Armatimonadota bacterium]
MDAEYGHTARFYDDFGPYRERPDVAFYVEEAQRSGGPVLELGCGTGRVLLPTARAGIAITGLDASEAMLAQCRRRVADEPADVQARVTLVRGDMRDFRLDQRYALATIPFRPFQHLVTVAEQLACLHCVREHLRPDGRLVMDLFNPSLPALLDERRLTEQPEGGPYTTAEGIRVQRSSRIVERDLATQVLTVELVYELTHPDGSTERLADRFPMRYLFRYEAEHLLARAGFELTAVYGGFDRSPFGTVCPGEIILDARPAG